MASWGLELELHGINMSFEVLKIGVSFHGQKERQFMLPQKICIGPSRMEEIFGLKSLFSEIRREISGLGSLDTEQRFSLSPQRCSSLLAQMPDEFFDVYGESILLYQEDTHPLKGSTEALLLECEKKLAGHLKISADHGAGGIIPEFITLPWSRRYGGPPEDDLTIENSFDFLNTAFMYLVHLTNMAKNPGTPYVRKFAWKNSIIMNLFQLLNSNLFNNATITLYGYTIFKRHKNFVGTYSYSPVFIHPQINTIIDLTHFRPCHSETSEYLPDFLRLSHFAAYGTKLDLQIEILNFSRGVVGLMSQSVKKKLKTRVTKSSDPWLEGAVGLGIWTFISLTAWDYEPGPHCVNKNLWLMMPKTAISDVLMGAFRADPTYYLYLVSSFVSSYYTLRQNPNPKWEFLKLNLVNGYQIVARIKRLVDISSPNTSLDAELSLRPQQVMESLIFTLLGSVFGKDGLFLKLYETTIDPETYYLISAYYNLYSFIDAFASGGEKISLKQRGGYGRPKFELRAAERVNIRQDGYFNTPWKGARDKEILIRIFHSVAEPTVPLPIAKGVPSHLEPGPQSVDSFAGASFDTAGGDNASGLWIPGLVEQGRRTQKRVQDWIVSQKEFEPSPIEITESCSNIIAKIEKEVSDLVFETSCLKFHISHYYEVIFRLLAQRLKRLEKSAHALFIKAFQDGSNQFIEKSISFNQQLGVKISKAVEIHNRINETVLEYKLIDSVELNKLDKFKKMLEEVYEAQKHVKFELENIKAQLGKIYDAREIELKQA